jgi:hypothetical protein
MKNIFSLHRPSEAELALQKWRVLYKKKKDGTLVTSMGIDLFDKGLTTLPDLSRVIVQGDFICFNNNLESLKGSPAVVSGDFYCFNNKLTSLEGAPKKFRSIKSDFGVFSSWDEIPEELRVSPETLANLKLEKEEKAREQEEAWLNATDFSKGIDKPIAAPKPLNLKRGRAP